MLAIGAAAAATAAALTTQGAAAATNSTTVHRLDADTTGAQTTDQDLVNAWGLSQGPSTPVWVSDNGSGKTTLYKGSTKIPLTVTIPGGAPTGQVFNPGTGFKINGATGMQPALFIFASESGAISAWNQSHGTSAVKAKTVKGAIFKGLAIAQGRDGLRRIYAADFHNNRVDVFGQGWRNVTPAGSFRDRTLPHGYAPFGIAHLRGRILVSYALQDSTAHDDVKGVGHGYVDVFDYAGHFVRRLVSRGALDSPWGMALAPASFGRFGGDLLVGNFGNGLINAYDPTNGARLGRLQHPNGLPIHIDGLWGLRFGNGNAAKTGELLFSAGPDGESHGLLGKIVVAH
jgi:uncharacterized protein (TIGR03118 family)